MQHDESPVDDQAAGSVTIEIALVVDDELVVAFEQLIPQLSSSSPPPTREALCDLVDGGGHDTVPRPSRWSDRGEPDACVLPHPDRDEGVD